MMAKPDKFATAGMGATQPVAQNTVGGKANPEGQRLNRRMVITLHYPDNNVPGKSWAERTAPLMFE
jgi:hypothetical protein